MKVIFAVDCITPPLTGIGRYAWELAQRLPHISNIDQVRYFSFGRWRHLQEMQEQLSTAANFQKPSTPSLRSRLSQSTLAVKGFHFITPHFFAWRLKQEKESLYHSPNYFLPPFPGRSIATIHDLSHIYHPEFHPTARVAYILKALPDALRRADFLITDAESVRQEVIAQFDWPADRIAAIPLAASDLFHPRDHATLASPLKSYGLKPGHYTLNVGTIEPRKNLLRLIEAYERLPHSTKKTYPLVLAGAEGWQSEGIHQRIKKAHSAGWLYYLNYASPADLPLLYAGARLFAYPSLYEGFGLPPLEAMASGIPVITSNRSSLPEVVGDAALTLHPADDLALTEALKKCLEDEAWRSTAIARGIQRAAQFSWSRCAAETAALYQKISAS